MASSALHASLAITSLITNKRKWNNNCFIKFNSLNFKCLEVRNTSEKSEKIRVHLIKIRYCAIPGQTDAGSSQNYFLPFRILLNIRIDPNFPQKVFFFFALFREKFCFPAKIHVFLA